MKDGEPTKALQGVPDRHSGLSEEDVSDIICILYPHSDRTGLEVQRLANENSPHVVRKHEVYAVDKLNDELEDTAFEPKRTVQGDYAIILRLSSQLKDPSAGFVFGQSRSRCDVAFAHDPAISNMHFRIYPDENGSVIIEDLSTNCTVVKGRLLSSQQRADVTTASPHQVLSSGETIKVFLNYLTQNLEFRVRIPRRNDEDQRDHLAKIREHPTWDLLAYPWGPHQPQLPLGSTSAVVSKRSRSRSSEHGSSDEVSSSAVAHPVKRLKGLPATQYTIAWICALQWHLKAATMMLDEVHAESSIFKGNAFILGSMGQHNVLITGPVMSSQIRDFQARLTRLFPMIKLVLTLGSGGGIPGKHDIRLGDVVVGTRRRVYSTSDTERRTPLGANVVGVSAFRLRYGISNAREFESILDTQSKKHPDYRHPNLRDRLFKATYSHVVSGGAPSSMATDSRPAKSDSFTSSGNMPEEASNCDHCDDSQTVLRSVRATEVPRVHFGGILSSPKIIQDAAFRDQLGEEFRVICVDNWEVGKICDIPLIHVRGICDYSDTHGNRGWQRFAALSAASLAKDLMADVPVGAPWVLSAPHVSADYFFWKRRELLQSFKFETMNARFHNIRSALRKTCDWLPELPEYQQWLDFRDIEKHHGILWIRGKPGVGKSTIMKFAYTQLLMQQNLESSVVVSFFFNLRGDDLEKGMIGLYRSLLTQILEALPDFANLLDRPHIPWSRGGFCPGPDVLKALLKDAVSRLGQRSLTCFIDALDECNGVEAADVVRFFQDLTETAVKEGIRLRICISTRHYPYIESRAGNSLILEALEGHTNDLSYYIRDKLRVNGDIHVLQHKILEGSAGIFLWVVLIVDMLNKAHGQGRTASLTSLTRLTDASSPLADLWIDILRRSPTQTAAHELSTMWMLSAIRPLSLHEYHHALWSGLNMNSLGADPPPGGNIDELEATAASSVISFSKGLAEVTRGEGSAVQFIHESVRSFLLEGDRLEFWRDTDVIHAGKRHEFIKQCCSFYLSHEAEGRGRDQPSPRTRDFVLLAYAAHNILDHAEYAAEMVDQQEFLAKFDLNEWLEAYNATEHNTLRQYDPSTSLIYVLADRGLPRLIRLWLKANSMIHALHYPLLTHGRHPIFAALASGNKEAVAVLLGTSSTVIYGSDITEGLTHRTASDFSEFAAHTPLTWAAGRGLPGIVQWMLECGVGVAELDEGGHTALSRACAGARFEVAQLLLSHGAHPDGDASNQEKPLVQAARHGHVRTCQMMLDAGADLNALDRNGHTALSAAYEEGRLGVVEYLLGFGRTLSLGDFGHRNPLVEACRGGHFELARWLLRQGTQQVNSQDSDGWTPLTRAAERGDVHILRLLLENGADIHARFQKGLTPLLVAAREGHCSMAHLLLEAGADVDDASESGTTAMMVVAEQADISLVELLLSHGANVNAMSQSGLSPLMFAAREGHYYVVDLLLQHGADENLKSVDGLSALAFAVIHHHDSIVELLLEANADPNTSTSDGPTPLRIAIVDNLVAISRLLLGNGADPNIKFGNGLTPLILAVQNGRDNIVGLLLEAGADVEAASADGVSPLMLAVEMGSSVTARRLLDRGAKFSAAAQVGAAADRPDIAPVPMAHEEDSQLVPTDSGYASTYMAERKMQSDEEVGTVYSAASTNRSWDEENYILELAGHMTSGVSLPNLDDEITERIVSILPGLLKDFALKIGHGQPVQMERDAMAFVHRHRNAISSKFIELSEEKDVQVKPTEGPEEMTWYERVSLLDRDPDEKSRLPATSENDLSSPKISSRLPTPSAPSESSLTDTEADTTLTRPNEMQAETRPRGQLHVYSDHLANGTAYRWLIMRLQREIDHVTVGEGSLDNIRQTIISSLPTVRKLSRKLPSPTCSAVFHVHWEILRFFETQGYPQPWEEVLEHVLTLTGSACDAYALTCTQYIQQMWPGTGDALIEWLKKTIREGIGTKCKHELPDGMNIYGEISKSGLTVEVSGIAAFVVETGEQLAWLGASMQVSPADDGIMLCTPTVTPKNPGKSPSLSSTATSFDINFKLESIPQPRTNGQCWHDLFRNPVVVKGYPIPRRLGWNTGLEIPLDILVGLARSQRVDEFKSKIYIKGFSTLLVATKRSNDILHWHLVFHEDGTQVSFLDDTLPPQEEIRYADVLGSRHIVGWCLKAEVHAGAPSAQYPSEYRPPNRAPEGGALAHVVVQVGQTIVPPRAIFGLKDTPRHVSHESDYIPRLESLHRRFVLLWDEQDKRGWLVNGTSALLHVLRASLNHNTKGPLRNRLVCRSEHLRESNEPLEVDTAIDVLANEANFNLQLYDGDKHTLLKGQIEHFCYVFEKLFDYQRDAMGDIGKTLCKTPRGSLEGWDFEDLVKKEEQLYPCASRIESAGKGWVDFTRSISAVTVLARDFGEMIKPGGDGFCHHWGELPKGLYYIASALKDLEGLTRRYSRGADNVVQVSESLVWHTPTTCFAACECHDMMYENRCEPVQTILPAQLSGTIRPRDRQFERRGAGAVIFGHNSYFPWHWEDTGDPVPIQPTNTIALTEPAPKESDSFKDSALGTSPSVSSAGERDSPSRTRPLPLTGSNQTHHKALKSSILGNARQHADYTVGIICALPKELRAVRLLFDDGHHESLPRQDNDSNTYVLGKMGHHLVVATCLPSKDIGTASAAVTATSMMTSFVSVQFILLVGIAGGVRSETDDIRLGDVVISRFQGTTSGVVSYDQGAENADQSFERRGPSMGPSRLLCAALSIMESAPDHLCFDLQPHLASIAARRREYRRPDQEADKDPRMQCDSCKLRQPHDGQCCEEPNTKPFDLPEIHYGVIASGNRVVKRAEFRDQVAGQYNALCFEMEAAGVFKATSNCLVIRGISDYCDAEKNDSWQNYAAAAAASYARVLLDQIPAKRNGNASRWDGGTEETSRKRRRV